MSAGARARVHALLGKAFAPKGSDEAGIIFCGAHTGSAVYHTPLCEALTAHEETRARDIALARFEAIHRFGMSMARVEEEHEDEGDDAVLMSTDAAYREQSEEYRSAFIAAGGLFPEKP